jgi:hypothetical protein
MLECFLLLRQAGPKWAPLIAIPAVLAGGLAAICMMLSGIKGIVTAWYRPKRSVRCTASREQVVQWTDPKRATAQTEGSGKLLPHQS